MQIGKALTSTTVGMKLYHRHMFNSVINTTWISHLCGLADIWNIHYNL